MAKASPNNMQVAKSNRRRALSGRSADYSAPPPRIPAGGFPAPSSCRRAAAAQPKALQPLQLEPVGSRLRRHAISGAESGACVAARLPSDRLPSLHTLRHRFEVGFVRGFIGTVQPSDSSRLPRQLRLLDFLSRPGIALATAGGVR